MKINEVLEELKKTYPGKKIILNKNNLTEILCEIDPAHFIQLIVWLFQ